MSNDTTQWLDQMGFEPIDMGDLDEEVRQLVAPRPDVMLHVHTPIHFEPPYGERDGRLEWRVRRNWMHPYDTRWIVDKLASAPLSIALSPDTVHARWEDLMYTQQAVCGMGALKDYVVPLNAQIEWDCPEHITPVALMQRDGQFYVLCETSVFTEHTLTGSGAPVYRQDEPLRISYRFVSTSLVPLERMRGWLQREGENDRYLIDFSRLNAIAPVDNFTAA